MVQINFNDFAERLGTELLSKRLNLQAEHAADIYTRTGYGAFHIENLSPLYTSLKYLLKFLRLYKQGRKNTLAYQIEENVLSITDLPSEFLGLKILHLSDLHLDSIWDNGEALTKQLGRIQADVCVITGDFRYHTHGEYRSVVDSIHGLLTKLSFPKGVFGVLGNHDFIEVVPFLEDIGVQMLLNESVSISSGEAELWLCGIDDAHSYACHDIPKSLGNVPENSVKILLSHTPEVYEEAYEAGFNSILCGHTHGGQICLPGKIPIITNVQCPRRFSSGSWLYHNMSGYTSRGVGTSFLPVRYFCPPELTVHILSR